MWLLLLLLWVFFFACLRWQEAAFAYLCVSCRYISLHFTCSKFHAIFKPCVWLSVRVWCVCVLLCFDKHQQLPAYLYLHICVSVGCRTGSFHSFSRAPAHVLHTRWRQIWVRSVCETCNRICRYRSLYSTLSVKTKKKRKTTKFQWFWELLKRFVLQFLSVLILALL